MDKLTEHFTFEELTDSAEHPQLVAQNRIEALPHRDKLVLVAQTILEPVRVHYGKPVIVTSGFRGPTLNAAVKGVPTSQHCKAEAADFIVPGVTDEDVLEWMRHNIPQWGQFILEYSGNRRWLHGSLGEPYRPIERCREVLRFDGHDYLPA